MTFAASAGRLVSTLKHSSLSFLQLGSQLANEPLPLPLQGHIFRTKSFSDPDSHFDMQEMGFGIPISRGNRDLNGENIVGNRK